MRLLFQKAANFALMPNLVLAQAAIFRSGTSPLRAKDTALRAIPRGSRAASRPPMIVIIRRRPPRTSSPSSFVSVSQLTSLLIPRVNVSMAVKTPSWARRLSRVSIWAIICVMPPLAPPMMISICLPISPGASTASPSSPLIISVFWTALETADAYVVPARVLRRAVRWVGERPASSINSRSRTKPSDVPSIVAFTSAMLMPTPSKAFWTIFPPRPIPSSDFANIAHTPVSPWETDSTLRPDPARPPKVAM